MHLYWLCLSLQSAKMNMLYHFSIVSLTNFFMIIRVIPQNLVKLGLIYHFSYMVPPKQPKTSLTPHTYSRLTKAGLTMGKNVDVQICKCDKLTLTLTVTVTVLHRLLRDQGYISLFPGVHRQGPKKMLSGDDGM